MKTVAAEFVKSAFSLKDCPAGKLPEVALAGRSNVGKSSLLNRLVNRKGLARVSNTPGRTRMINFFLVNGAVYLVDLPGYGYARVPVKMKLDWGEGISEYLKKRENLAGVALLLDIRHGPTDLDLQLYQWLCLEKLPVVLVATKVDKLSKSQALNRAIHIRKTLGLEDEKPLVSFSSKTGQGVEELWRLIESMTGLRTQNDRGGLAESGIHGSGLE